MSIVKGTTGRKVKIWVQPESFAKIIHPAAKFVTILYKPN